MSGLIKDVTVCISSDIYNNLTEIHLYLVLQATVSEHIVESVKEGEEKQKDFVLISCLDS